MENSEWRRRQMLRSIELFKREKQKPGFGVYVLTIWTVALWLVGCFLIGYMAWVLATSVTVKQFMSGKLIFVYIVVGLGFLFFSVGLLGWVAATSISACILRMYITISILALALEIGCFLTLTIMQIHMEDIIEHGWREMNQGTRNIVQQHLRCCGYIGPKDFAYRNDPIDDTCYEMLSTSQVTVNSTLDNFNDSPTLKQYGCGNKLLDWFQENQSIWASVLIVIGLFQLFGVISAIYVINSAKRFRIKVMAEMLEIPSRNGYLH